MSSTNSTTDNLSQRLAELARELQQHTQVQTTAEHITTTAVDWTGPGTAAGISMVQRRRSVDSLATTSDVVKRGDAMQYELGEGPCLDAIWEQPQVYVADLRTDQRWPRWSPRVAEELDVSSMLCTRLFTNDDTLGALNVYSPHGNAFDEQLRDEITTLAAHAAVAVADAAQIEGLTIAVDRRTKIGMALGMVMERYELDEARAFDVLKRLSSHTNTKLYDIARDIVDTGRLPG
jgi:transcriptional regulator with GAF, ATPase, and Fis domain